MQKYTIMGIFAHPDDESFGPGGTLAKYAHLGHKVITITATRGQAGQSSDKQIIRDTGYHREQELRRAAKVLGVKKTIVLDFFDGTLNEHQLPVLKKLIAHEARRYKPDVIITYERNGISLHIDHIAVSKAVTQLIDEGKIKPKKFYYFGLGREMAVFAKRNCYLDDNKLAKIDIKDYWKTKLKAIEMHASQDKDFKRIIERNEQVKKQGYSFWSYEHFELYHATLKKITFPETDLLNGL